MSWWDQFWQDMGNVIGNALAGVVGAFLTWTVQIIAFTPSLNYPFVSELYGFTFGIFLGVMGIAIAGIGLLYILSPVLEKKVEYRTIWAKLFGALVISVSAFLIGNLLISLANALTDGIFATMAGCGSGISSPGCQGNLSNLWSNLFRNLLGSSGFLVLVVSLTAIILLITIIVENGVRILMIFFSFILLPWGLLLWAFPTTQSYGVKLSKMFFEWVFVGVFMALAFTLTVLMMSSGGIQANWVVMMAIFLGGLSLVAAVPKIVTESGGAVSNVGQAVAGGVIGGTFMGSGEGLGGGGGGMMPAGGMGMPMPGGSGGGSYGGGGARGGWKGLGQTLGQLGKGVGRAGMVGIHHPMAAGGAMAGAGIMGMAGLARTLHHTMKNRRGQESQGAPLGSPQGLPAPLMGLQKFNRQRTNDIEQRMNRRRN